MYNLDIGLKSKLIKSCLFSFLFIRQAPFQQPQVPAPSTLRIDSLIRRQPYRTLEGFQWLTVFFFLLSKKLQ